MKSVLSLMAALMIPAAAFSDELPVDTFAVVKNVPLDEVVVTATKAVKGTPVAYSNLSRNELSQRNDGQGIPYLISLTPSVIMTSDDGTGIGYSSFRIRGTDAARINVTVNGVPINDTESQAVFWVNMPDFASSVQNIQIQRGAGTSTNGAAAFGATVAMETQYPGMIPYGEYSLSAGSFGTVKHTVQGGTGLLHDHFVLDARYSDVRSDGFIDRASVNMSSYFVSAAWYADRSMLKFQTFGSSEKTYQAWNGVGTDMLKQGNRTYNSCGEYYDENGQLKFYDNQTDNYWQHHYHLIGSRQLSNFWSMNLTLHYTPGKGYYEDYKSGAKYASYKLNGYLAPDGTTNTRTDLIRRKWLDNDFYGGIYSANYRKENLHFTFGTAINNYEGYHFGNVIWAKAANALPDPNYEYYRSKGEKLDYSTYAKANWIFLSGWNAYIDLQYRGIDYSIKGENDKSGGLLDVDKTWNFFNPKAGFNYQHGGHNAFVSFSVANREPSRDNFTEIGPKEKEPEHETLYDYEAGYTFRNNSFHAGVNLYYMDYDNQLVLTGKLSEIGERLTANIKDSYRAGIELSGGVSLTSWLQWNGNLTLSRNKVKNYTDYMANYDSENGDEVSEFHKSADIAFSPDIMGNSMFDIVWKGFSASFNSQAVGRQYLDNTSNKECSIDPYFVSSLRLGYAFKPRFMKEAALDVTINNLFNEKYESNGWAEPYYEGGVRKYWAGYFTQAGTNVMARIKLSF